MTALALAMAYLGSLAALCWAWREVRVNPSTRAELDALRARAAVWDQAVGDIETLRIQAGLKPRTPR